MKGDALTIVIDVLLYSCVMLNKMLPFLSSGGAGVQVVYYCGCTVCVLISEYTVCVQSSKCTVCVLFS